MGGCTKLGNCPPPDAAKLLPYVTREVRGCVYATTKRHEESQPQRAEAATAIGISHITTCSALVGHGGGRGAIGEVLKSALGAEAAPPGACCQTPLCHLVKRPRLRGLLDQLYCTVC